MRFIENMSVGRKLAVAFGVVLAAIAVMGVVVVTNLLALQRADHARNLEGEINQVLAVAEFRLSKQENSYRGYLLSQDPYYAERLDLHRAKFKEALEEVRAKLPADRAAPVDEAIKAADGWYANIVQVGKAMVAEGRIAEASRMVGQTGVADQFIAPVEEAIDVLRAENEAAREATRKAQAEAAQAAGRDASLWWLGSAQWNPVLQPTLLARLDGTQHRILDLL